MGLCINATLMQWNKSFAYHKLFSAKMEKSKQLVSEFPCVTSVLGKIHSNELVFIAISKDNEGESFDATLRVKATNVSGDNNDEKSENLRHCYERATNTGLIVDRIQGTPVR
jgi:hypothetical protein